jgi:VanZ family protein
LSVFRAHSGGRLPRLLFWAAALFSLVMALLPHPPDIPGHPSDKIQHVAAFATLALLGTWAFPRTALIRLLAGLSLFGAAIEVLQAIPILHRDSDVLDWLADTIAAGSILLVARCLRARSRVAPPRR